MLGLKNKTLVVEDVDEEEILPPIGEEVAPDYIGVEEDIVAEEISSTMGTHLRDEL